MSLRLIKPGMSAMDLEGTWFLRRSDDGGSEDPDDKEYTDDDVEDEDEDDEEDDKPKPKGKKKVVKKEEDDDDEDEEEKLTRPERQAARYRVRLRESEKREAALAARLKAIEDKDKPPDEVATREATEARQKAEQLATQNRSMTLELAFFKSNTVDWIDPNDALRLVDLDEVDVDEDGTVDAKALRAALKDLAKRKPHLVKPVKASGKADEDEDEDEEDEEPRSRRTAPTMNGRRKGKTQTKSREELAKKFPVLGRL